MKKILIPIDASKELPEKDGTYFIDLNTDKPGMIGKNVSWFRTKYDNEAWKENVKYWLKEVTIDELYLPGEVEQKIFAHFKDNHDVLLMDDDFNCLQNIIINYIKQKLEG